MGEGPQTPPLVWWPETAWSVGHTSPLSPLISSLPSLPLSLDSQSVVDIFLNYDCDLSLSNIYARLVNDLSRIGQGRQAVELGATPHEQKLIRAKVKGRGLE